MDTRRLSTADFLRSGMMNMPAPETRVPEGIDLHDLYLDENEIIPKYIKDLLAKGDGVEAAQDYGCWAVWKVNDGYDGELMQYRRITEGFCNRSLDEAADRAYTWYRSLG